MKLNNSSVDPIIECLEKFILPGYQFSDCLVRNAELGEDAVEYFMLIEQKMNQFNEINDENVMLGIILTNDSTSNDVIINEATPSPAEYGLNNAYSLICNLLGNQIGADQFNQLCNQIEPMDSYKYFIDQHGCLTTMADEINPIKVVSGINILLSLRSNLITSIFE